MKKYLRGHNRQYFKLIVIAMYSTMHKLSTLDSNFQYLKYAFKIEEYKTSPPAFTA